MTKKLTTKDFVKRAEKIYGNKYDYSKIEYINNRTKICIICPEHGEFWQTPDNHLHGHICPKCTHRNAKYTKNEFVKEAKNVHGCKYDYSKVNYINSKTKICIICPEHGSFWQTPNSHLNGHGCFKCAYLKNSIKKKSTKEQFIEKAKIVHGDKYVYSKVEYINNSTKVCIICPVHGEFWQKPNDHLNGRGCPICNCSKLENEIKSILDYEKIKYKNRERKLMWLEGLELDFYLPEYNIAIECQGIQHFEPREMFGGEKYFKTIQKHDEIKQILCKNNNIDLLYFTHYKKIDEKENIYKNKNKLIEYIKNNAKPI